jgi:UDP-N-acetylmuramate dehydrogenase
VTGAAEIEAVAGALGGLAQRAVGLGALTTYRVGGPAALFVEAGSDDDLLAVRRALQGRPLPVLVLGRGSNLLVADGGFPGLVVHLGPSYESITVGAASGGGPPADGTVLVEAGAATSLPVLARRSVREGLAGLEWGVGVPGSVGGAVRMNAGGHGSDVAASLVAYRWLDLASERGAVSRPDQLAYAYRTSSVTPTEVILSATFALTPGDRSAGENLLSEIVRWRRANQPGGSNAGSVFVNPEGDSAGRLIEECGLKGRRLGSATVSAKHANFIQADEGGSADDVRALIALVAREVAARTGVALHTEVRLVGTFGQENGVRAPNEQGAEIP